jgi:1-acyl-sn-glycerol-3-phosphate acyltransferase
MQGQSSRSIKESSSTTMILSCNKLTPPRSLAPFPEGDSNPVRMKLVPIKKAARKAAFLLLNKKFKGQY